MPAGGKRQEISLYGEDYFGLACGGHIHQVGEVRIIELVEGDVAFRVSVRVLEVNRHAHIEGNLSVFHGGVDKTEPYGKIQAGSVDFGAQGQRVGTDKEVALIHGAVGQVQAEGEIKGETGFQRDAGRGFKGDPLCFGIRAEVDGRAGRSGRFEDKVKPELVTVQIPFHFGIVNRNAQIAYRGVESFQHRNETIRIGARGGKIGLHGIFKLVTQDAAHVERAADGLVHDGNVLSQLIEGIQIVAPVGEALQAVHDGLALHRVDVRGKEHARLQGFKERLAPLPDSRHLLRFSQSPDLSGKSHDRPPRRR